MRLWSLKYSKCINCGTDSIEYKGRGLCKKCYDKVYDTQHTGKCSFCKKIKTISTIKGGEIICKACHKKYFYTLKKDKCSICKNIGVIDKIEGDRKICKRCYKKYVYTPPKDVCTICGELKLRECYKDGKPICHHCYVTNYYEKPIQKCDVCGNQGYVNLIKDEKKYCRKCYKKLRKQYYNALSHRWRALVKNSPGSISENDFKTILERDKVCVFCGGNENLTFDHIIPISKGGRSDMSNYVVACWKCNLSKGKKDVFEWCKSKKIKVPKIVKQLLNKKKR